MSVSNAESTTASSGQENSIMEPSATRPLYWSIRRELWEHRAIYIAPLAAAGVVLFGFLIGLRRLPMAMHGGQAFTPMAHNAALVPYAFAAAAIGITGMIVAVFYCLGALNNERRDRSILFWKSLPVSDLTTVLSKAAIPLVVLPLVVFAIVVAAQLIMLALASIVLLANGLGPSMFWGLMPKTTVVLFYFLAVVALWYAPIFGWLLLVSGWARRVAFLWAVLPVLAAIIIEKIGLDTSHFASLVAYRLTGFRDQAFFYAGGRGEIDPFGLLTPVRFLSSPGLWAGLVTAAGFLAAAVWLRRYREPS